MDLFGELLRATTVEIPRRRQYVLDRIFDERVYGPPGHRRPAQLPSTRCDHDTLTEHLVGGMTKQEVLDRIDPSRAPSRFHVLDLDDFVLEPLPNHLYARDTSAWIHGGVSINSMKKKARVRETVHYEAVYRWHPLYADAGFRRLVEGSADEPATTEGGDMLVIGGGAVLVGISERTTAAGRRAARPAGRSPGGEVDRIVALRMPETRR